MKPPLAATEPADFFRANDWRPEESLAYLLGQPFGLMNEAMDSALESTGLTHAQWVPLLKLHLGEASTVGDLGRKSQINAGAMTRMLDRLETKDLVQRVRCGKDRRIVRIELTRAGRDTAKEIPAALSKCMNALLAGFTLDEWRQLQRLLKRVIDNAERVRKEQVAQDLRMIPDPRGPRP